MVHGPCSAPCMETIQTWTSMATQDPEYYRPNDGRVYMVGDRRPLPEDNWCIVPYCPYVSAKYNRHINVECAVSPSLYRRDEITRWDDGRYCISPHPRPHGEHFILMSTTRILLLLTRLQVHLPSSSVLMMIRNKFDSVLFQSVAH